MAVSAGVIGLAYSQIHHLNPIHELTNQVSTFVNYLGQNPSLVNPDDLDDWKRSLVVEFPSSMAIFAMVLIWANLVVVLRVNPNGIREKMGLDASFFKRWKAPEYLVWPTIVSGFFLVMNVGTVSDIALNVFKALMAVYVFQGLSIISYFFDLWKVRGLFRFIGYLVSLMLMMALVLSLGFFDLWFDFRNKFRQS
jgi:uncharacterized protein YybS (DUF2232 family)